MSIYEKKRRHMYGLFMQNKCFYRISSFCEKKDRHSWKLNNLSKKSLNQWESMGFHKLILDFANPTMRLVKNIWGHSLKIKSLITQGLQCKLQEISLKIIAKKSVARTFWNNLEKPHFGPFMLKYKSSPKIDLHKNDPLKMPCHMWKNWNA